MEILCGYEVMDNIKAPVEYACPSSGSCVDILALAVDNRLTDSGGTGVEGVVVGVEHAIIGDVEDVFFKHPLKWLPLGYI